jgi:hypothetical protein
VIAKEKAILKVRTRETKVIIPTSASDEAVPTATNIHRREAPKKDILRAVSERQTTSPQALSSAGFSPTEYIERRQSSLQ